jgi:alpha-1,6-mannosyltransferase
MHFADITMFYAAEGGGVSTYLNAKSRWLHRHSSVRHTILSPNVLPRHGVPELASIPGHAIPGLNGYRLPLSIATSARVLSHIAPDLVEAGDAGPCAWAALRVKRELGIPAVAFYHSDLPRLVGVRYGAAAARVASAYLARLYRQFDLVLAPSHLMVRRLAAMGVHGALHQPLGIDARTFRQPRRGALLRQRLGLRAATRLLVYAGRFTAEKKLDVLVDAVRLLGQPYHLLLVGAGQAPVAPDCKATVLPFRRDPHMLARLLSGCDMLVHPGDRETFGLIVLEAMASGLPVVGTSGGAVAELVDPATGILVQPNSATALAAGIDAMYACDMAAMGCAAARKASEHFDWQRIMPQLLRRYGGLLAAHARHELEAGTACVSD